MNSSERCKGKEKENKNAWDIYSQERREAQVRGSRKGEKEVLARGTAVGQHGRDSRDERRQWQSTKL